MKGLLFYLKEAIRSYFRFSKSSAGRLSLRRFLLVTFFYLLFFPWLITNSICLACDPLFFRFRKIVVKSPLFIVGVPRSGTTFLFRLMALDREQFTTMPLWELVLAPSLIQKFLFRGLATADRWLGGLGKRLIRWAERLLFGSLDSIHKTSLFEPEEDYLALIPVVGCFLMVQPFPDSERVWRLAHFDSEVDENERRTIMRFYQGILQRHLYFRGAEKSILSKNPSFTPMTKSLRETFPDCRIIGCVRDPIEAVPSLLNSMKTGGRALANRFGGTSLQTRFINMLAHFYRSLKCESDSDHLIVSPYRQLTTDPEQLVLSFYRRWQLKPGQHFQEALHNQCESSKSYRSKHQYRLADFDLEKEWLAEVFSDVIPFASAEGPF